MNGEVLPWQAARTITPPPRKSLFQRLYAANKAWAMLMNSVRDDAARTPLTGAKYYPLIHAFVAELVDDPVLETRVMQHIEHVLREEGPKEQGRLI
jgi:hypothetical protein